MRSGTVTDQCPPWCARDHSAHGPARPFYHASETRSVTISRPQCPGGPERLDVETAQYFPDDADDQAGTDDPAGTPWTPTVELALHAGGRYRLIGLTPQEARELAAMLARAASMPGSSGPAGQD